MGFTWQTPEQRTYISDHLPLYIRHSTDGTEKTGFWPDFLTEWFERWPHPEPSPEFVERVGMEKAAKVERVKQINRLKRVFKTLTDENATGGRKKLHLEDPIPRKRSEVQIYMSLFYDTRIRSVVQKRWAEADIPNMDFSRSEIPEDQVDPEDSSLLKDVKIPLFFKKLVAQEMYDAEDEEVKGVVRATRDAESLIKTVQNTSGEERQDLIREYQKNISSLKKSMVTILRNAEKKCAAKGIFWLACPTASAEGKPVGQFHCIGTTDSGEDFEAFLGPEKSKEFRGYFTAWIHQIYPPSEWSLYSLDTKFGTTLMTRSTGETATDLDDAELPPLEPCTPSQTDFRIGRPVADDSLDSPDMISVQYYPTGVTNPPTESSQQTQSSSGSAPSGSFALSLTTGDALWMKKKKTIEYFRAAFKLGKLADVIERWYELEKLLGFPEITPPGFKTTKRPGVIPMFYKNGHNYRKDYGLKAEALGPNVMAWWAEICSEGESLGVQYGGPTGIYSLVVLLTWWCALLKDEPEHKRIDCLLTIANVDVVLQLTVGELESGVNVVPTTLSTPVPPPPTQPRKRANSGDVSPQKRIRTE